MEIFEYLPQLIIAYDGNDEFANLIHVKKADRDKNYFCPCCGGTVKPRALDSNKEQSHYYHKTGKCTKESQLHFFCKNWLFEKGSKFYINDELFEVSSIEIEKSYFTPFGTYKPDVTVHTTNGKIIYFEMFFTNRKTGDDYFCKWNALGNDVVEVNIKEYMFKTDTTTIPSFTYLYHDGICYSKTYVKRDLYANTIARIKHELTRQKVLNYKARIEQLDWFWQEIRKNTRESILDIVSQMEYEDMVSCYEIIKKKQCVSYLKEDVLNMVNQRVISDVRHELDLPNNNNVYFDLKHIKGRTYEAGIRLNVSTEHIIYDGFLFSYGYGFTFLKGYPKIVFKRNIFTKDELCVPNKVIKTLKQQYEETEEFRKKILLYDNEISEFEKDKYKIRVKNNVYTVLIKENEKFVPFLNDYKMNELNIKDLSLEIEKKKQELKERQFVDTALENEIYCDFLEYLKSIDNFDFNINFRYVGNEWGYKEKGIYFKLSIGKKDIYDKKINPSFEELRNLIIEYKNIINDYTKKYSIISDIVNEINNCKNNFWKAEITFDYAGYPEILIDQKIFEVKKRYLLTYEKADLKELIGQNNFTKEKIKDCVKDAMLAVFENMEECGYRVMEVRE